MRSWVLVSTLLLAVVAAFAVSAAPCPHAAKGLRTLLPSDNEGPMRDPDTFQELIRHVNYVKEEFAEDLAAMSCDSCIDVVSKVAKASMNETTMAKIIQTAQIGCAVVFAKKPKDAETCKKVSKLVLSLLPKATAALMKLDWEPAAFCSLIVPVCSIDCCLTKDAPEQVHLAYTENHSTEMMVSWVAQTETAESFVEFAEGGSSSPKKVLAQESTTYHFANWNGRVYHTRLTGLKPDTVYIYTVSSNGISSEPFSFRTLPFEEDLATPQRPLRILQFADVDYGIGRVLLDTLAETTANHDYHAVLLVGDIGYADGYEAHWDQFMRALEPIAARTPVMVVPGNHEILNDFVAYRTRFRMPHFAETGNMYYSLRLGNTHVSMMSSESPINTPEIKDAQLQWFREEHASERAANATWHIAAFHRPMYCTTHSGKPQCGVFAEYLRKRAEKPFLDARIDLHISGHQHGYERMYPTAFNKRVNETYDAPGAPVYIVSGAGGNREGMRTVSVDQEWSAKGSEEQGFLSLTIVKSEMGVQYIGVPKLNVIDEITIRK
jgi:hypothetical protein